MRITCVHVYVPVCAHFKFFMFLFGCFLHGRGTGSGGDTSSARMEEILVVPQGAHMQVL